MFHTVEKARWWATIGRSIAQYGRGMSIVSSPTAFRHTAPPVQLNLYFFTAANIVDGYRPESSDRFIDLFRASK